jgi:hypothetical protein
MYDVLLVKAYPWGVRRLIVEVKSLTSANAERQLRLALGQVLRYQQLFRDHATAVIATEHEPSDPSWTVLCERLGVGLTWPVEFDGFFEMLDEEPKSLGV